MRGTLTSHAMRTTNSDSEVPVVQSAQERNAIKCVPVSAVDTAKEKPAKAKLPPLVACGRDKQASPDGC